MTIDNPFNKPPYVRQSRLCCVLNPTWKCNGCGGVVCSPCNEVEISCSEVEGVWINASLQGHLNVKCLEENPDLENISWLWSMVGDKN